MVVKTRDYIRIPPTKLNKSLEEAALEEFKAKYEGALISLETDRRENISNTGIAIAVLNIDVNPVGVLIAGDGASYHRAEADILVYIPFINEIVEGEVVSVTRSGLYINLGVIDGFIHINQVSDERVAFDPARGSLVLEESRRHVERGDVVRARIYATGLMPGKGIRIHMTMRQPGLGKLAWIEETRE